MAKTKRKQSTFERLRQGKLNRKQRRNLARRLAGNDPGLTINHSMPEVLTWAMRVTSWPCLRTGTRIRCGSSAAGPPI